MASLLALLSGVSITSDIRYLAPGRSGAKVLVLANPKSLPLVVKLGRADDIDRETRNYADSLIDQTIPLEMRPTLQQSCTVGEYAALVYSWVGGLERVQTFRDFFTSGNETTIKRGLSEAMTGLVLWHGTTRLPRLPFDLWKWNPQALNRLRESLDAWPGETNTKQRLLTAVTDPHKWRDILITKHGGIGTCHGDLNCHNILISKTDTLPKLIDFASVLFDDCPARDWSKLERDIKLRCLRDLIKSPSEYITALAQVELACATEAAPTNASIAVTKTIAAVINLRSLFLQLSTNLSDIPSVEYFYFLLCWTLAYLNNQEGLDEPAEIRNAIINSAVQTLELLESEINRIDSISPHRGETDTDRTQRTITYSESNQELQTLATKFRSQLRIAGYVEDEKQVRHAVYLDEGLYVHRNREENAIADFISLSAVSSDGEARGRWLSVVGDAGHGKSSLLWHVFEELSRLSTLLVIPFMAQLENDLSALPEVVARIKEQSNRTSKLVVLIDTLDIAVGVEDKVLAGMLNSLKALGALIITSSRKQEADKLSIYIASNAQLEIRRYDDAEAQQAIRNQVRVHYRRQSDAEQQSQFERIWGLLEQQRNVRELDLEPLILRMIFEAYVPDDIPQDINTQQIYQQYWNQRVLYDRVVKTSKDRFDRQQVCRFIAREIVFGDGHSDKFPVRPAALVDAGVAGSPPEVIEGLVSTGVLQWAEGHSSVRFFHQTFLEFVAAYDLLSSDSTTRAARIETLLNDVTNFNLFRAPILKQLAIQSFEDYSYLHVGLIQDLRNINNELAAQLSLEIVGKLPGSAAAYEICSEWIEEDPSVLEDVIVETVRHYPKAKIGIALNFLRPFLTSDKETAIYSLCIDTLAQTEPSLVFDFLHQRLPSILREGDDDSKSYFKNAVCAAATYGENRAFGTLMELLPKVKAGLQSSILYSIAEITSTRNAHDVDWIVRSVSDLLPQIPPKNHNQVWDGLSYLVSALNRVAPETARATGRHLLDTEVWRRDIRSAIFMGRLAAQTGAYEASIEEALSQTRATDHLVRVFNAGFLAHAPSEQSRQIMTSILKLDPKDFEAVDTVRSLFAIVGGLRDTEPAQVFEFLGRWEWPTSGAGTPLAAIFKHLAANDPVGTKDWLLNQLRQHKDRARTIKLIRGLTVLIQERPDVFERNQLERIYERAFADKAGRQVFAAATGGIATVNMELAERIFDQVFAEEGKVSQLAAVNSLQRSVQSQPAFTLSVGPKVVDAFLRQHAAGVLDNYIVVLRSIPKGNAAALLTSFEKWFTVMVCAELDPKILSELLTVLKIACESNPRVAFKVSQRITILNKGIAGGLAALYDNVSEHSEDVDLLSEVLIAFGKIAGYSQLRMGNALRRSLPRLAHKLGRAPVIEMVIRTYPSIKHEQALRSLFRAAFAIPGWGASENAELLKDEKLPSSIRGLLSTRVRQ